MSKNSYPSVQNIYPKMQNCNKMSEFLAPGLYNKQSTSGKQFTPLTLCYYSRIFLRILLKVTQQC